MDSLQAVILIVAIGVYVKRCHWVASAFSGLNKKVQEHAYSLWEKEGRPEGRDLGIWLQAERKIKEDFYYSY